MAASKLKGSKEAQRARDRVLGPTLERQSKGDSILEEQQDVAGRRRTRVETQTRLDLYHKKGHISKLQYDAGNRLYGHFAAAGGLARITSSWAVRLDNDAGDRLARQVEAFERCSRALRYVGEQLSPVVVAVCLMDNSAREWALAQENPPESGIVVLRLALDRLARYYQKEG